MEDHFRLRAAQDFRSARSKAALEQTLARLRGRPAGLLSFEEVRQQLRLAHSTPRGLQEVALDAIVGSVGRYTDFTRSFLPLHDSDQTRWAGVRAAAENTGLPPVELYRIGDAYFVLDGNHRISVARELGAISIQAYVLDIPTRVPFSASDNPDDLICKARYVEFLERTSLDQLRADANLLMTVPGQYRILDEHIDVHRYFLGLETRESVKLEDAVASWYDNVYLPVVEVIRSQSLLQSLPDRTETDLYVWLAEHRARLESALEWSMDTQEVAADLAGKFGMRGGQVLTRLWNAASNLIVPASLRSGTRIGKWRKGSVSGRETLQLFSKILVSVSGDEQAWSALDTALLLAKHETAELRGLHISGQVDPAYAAALRSNFTKRCTAAGISGQLAIEAGTVRNALLARAIWADLLVLHLAHPPANDIGSRLASGLRAIIQACPRPVLATPALPAGLQRVLLAFDGSAKAREALYVAAYMAGAWDAALVVLHCSTGAHDALPEARAYLETHWTPAEYISVKHSEVAAAILQTAANKNCDLIVMGGYSTNPLREIAFGGSLDAVLQARSHSVLLCG
ncbi:MAG: universal stress protein [Chloroflexi bacterium]|nr:universal stress protein [Chloroflexota bacterium]